MFGLNGMVWFVFDYLHSGMEAVFPDINGKPVAAVLSFLRVVIVMLAIYLSGKCTPSLSVLSSERVQKP